MIFIDFGLLRRPYCNTFGYMLDVIICTNFGMETLRGLGNTGGQSLGSPIETTGYPYNSAALPHSL